MEVHILCVKALTIIFTNFLHLIKVEKNNLKLQIINFLILG